MSDQTSSQDSTIDSATDEQTDVEFIEAKVVDTIDSRELIIDAGSKDGVELGMRFAILGETSIKSDRAESGELEVRFKKTIVKIVRILDDYHSVGRTFKVVPGRPANPGLMGSISALRAWEATPEVPAHVETLNIADETPSILSRIAADQKKIRRGDIAEQTWGDEYDE